VRFYRSPDPAKEAFSLLEMVVSIAILAVLITLGVSLWSGKNMQSRRVSTDTLSGLIDQARTAAIASRSPVALVIAEPQDFSGKSNYCRVALFKINEWPELLSEPLVLKGELPNRWKNLDTGIILMDGDMDGIQNLRDTAKVIINYGGAKNLQTQSHTLIFNSRGGILWPSGSLPIGLRLAEGGYQNGKAIAKKRPDHRGIQENQLRIGRVTGRPYEIAP
jgi:prepilin-type N-terminal cleavage/methylation domain-containing protein